MKALELTVHQVDPTDPDMVVINNYWEYRPYVTAKRLTDAELAAEYYAQAQHHTMICYDDVYLRYVEEEPATTTGAQRFEEFRRLRVLERFATLPHYDESKP